MVDLSKHTIKVNSKGMVVEQVVPEGEYMATLVWQPDRITRESDLMLINCGQHEGRYKGMYGYKVVYRISDGQVLMFVPMMIPKGSKRVKGKMVSFNWEDCTKIDPTTLKGEVE